MAKSVLIGNEGTEKLIKGINTVADMVKITLGPKGKNVIISKGSSTPLITNDGATIANEITLKDPAENTGAQTIISASKRTNKEAGDGTTTTAILTQTLINEGIKLIEKDTDSIGMRTGMMKATSEIVKGIKRESKKIEDSEDIKKIATISSGSDTIGSLIAEAYDTIGKDGAITVEESKSNITSIEIKEGYKVTGSPSQWYFDDGNGSLKSTIELDNAGILVSASKIDNLTPFVDVLNEVGQQGGKLVIFAESISTHIINSLLMNYLRGLQVYAVDLSNLPDKVDILTDIAIATGAKLFNTEKGVLYKDITANDLGMAMKVKFKRDEETLLIDCQGDKEEKEKRVQEIKTKIEEDKSVTENQKTLLMKRISGLNKGIAVINLGTSSEMELEELKLRVEDALCSVKSSLEEGIVSGAGSTFIRIVEDLRKEGDSETTKSELDGQNLVYNSVASLLTQILKNADYSEERIKEVASEVAKTGKVYNLVTESYEDPETTNVFDPAKVERLSLETAVSTASTVLTTGGIIFDEAKKTGDLVLDALGIQN